MPRRIRRGATRKAVPRRRAWRRFTRRYKRIRGSRIHSFKRTCQLSPITVTGSTGAGQAFTFKLSDLSNYDEFSNLFDQYRIKAVKFVVIPTFSGNDIANQLTMSSFHSAIDHNDNSPATAVTELMEYDTYKRNRMSRGHKRYFSTSLATPANNSGNTFLTTWNRWVNTSTIGGPDEAIYFGLKMWIDGITQTTEFEANFEVYVTYYFQCKSVI